MFKVVAVDSVRMVPTVEREILAEAGAELFTADCHGEEDLIRATRDAHGLLVSLSHITRRVMASWSQARVIARYGIGVDTVDLGRPPSTGSMSPTCRTSAMTRCRIRP